MGSYDLRHFDLAWPTTLGVSVLIREGGALFQSLNGRLTIDPVTDMRITGSFEMTAVPSGTWGGDGYSYNRYAAGTRLDVVGTFRVVRDTASVPVLDVVDGALGTTH